MVISSYIVKQVKDTSGGGIDPDGLGDLWDRAKKANNPRMITDTYQILEGSQVYMQWYKWGDLYYEYSKRSDPSYIKGIEITTPDAPWDVMRYMANEELVGGMPTVVGSVWKSSTIVSKLEFKTQYSDWDKVDDVDASGSGTMCMRHIAEEAELVASFNTYHVYHEMLVTNVPHFASQADASEYTSISHGFWLGTQTLEQLKAFLRAKMVSP